MEEKVAMIWGKVLGMSGVGALDNFFELGGNSLLVIQVISEMKESLGTDISVRDMFMFPSVRQIVGVINDGRIRDEIQEISLERESAFDFVPVYTEGVRTGDGWPENILLTGSTGFIGRYLLRELLESTKAKVYCLVRGNEGFARQKEMLERDGLWKDEYGGRIICMAGDLSRPHFGLGDSEYGMLCGEIDVIYHNGANANYLGHYSDLKAVNVEGTKEVVRLAGTNRLKPVHYSSTITVFNSGDDRDVNEDDPIEVESHEFFPGYSGSKWVGEKVIKRARAMGIPCSIYRFGLITGDESSGSCDRQQWFFMLMKSFLQLGYAFDESMRVLNFPVSPVNYPVKSLVYLSLRRRVSNGTYHLCDTKRIPVQSLVRLYNESNTNPIEIVGFYDWIRIAEESARNGNSLRVLALFDDYAKMDRETLDAVLEAFSKRRLDIRCTATLAKLEGSGIRLPVVDKRLADIYFNYIKENEDLPIVLHDRLSRTTAKIRE
jgi:thioester reductase-like protein